MTHTLLELLKILCEDISRNPALIDVHMMLEDYKFCHEIDELIRTDCNNRETIQRALERLENVTKTLLLYFKQAFPDMKVVDIRGKDPSVTMRHDLWLAADTLRQHLLDQYDRLPA